MLSWLKWMFTIERTHPKGVRTLSLKDLYKFFTYLRVFIFIGVPKCHFLQHLPDKVKLKLAS